MQYMGTYCVIWALVYICIICFMFVFAFRALSGLFGVFSATGPWWNCYEFFMHFKHKSKATVNCEHFMRIYSNSNSKGRSNKSFPFPLGLQLKASQAWNFTAILCSFARLVICLLNHAPHAHLQQSGHSQFNCKLSHHPNSLKQRFTVTL